MSPYFENKLWDTSGKSTFQFFKPPESINQSLRDLKTKPASHWEKKGERMAMRLFKFVSASVPAYQYLLKKRRIRASSIKAISDFRKLPIIDKDYYLRRAKTANLFPNRDVSRVTTFSATSGSTGEPFYFPRGREQDAQYEYIAELFLKNQWEIDKHKTLGVIGFGLGIWIGGIFTYKNFNRIAEKGYQLSLVPAGANVDTFLRPIAKFGHLFDQIILMGYPPFIKDAIDEAKDYKIDWKKYRLRIMTAAEGYSEKFRNYISQKAQLKNPLIDTLNIYGTVELGTMAHETPLTNLIRRIAVENQKVFKEIFPQANRLPTLAQYHPQIVYFEEVQGEVIASGYGSAFPLLRYRFPDMGGVIKFDEMIKKLKAAGIDILGEAEKAKISHTIMRLPFVYVYDRSDHAVSLVGIILYPEYLRDIFHEEPFSNHLTGKFTMVIKYDVKQNQSLEVNLELKKRAKKHLNNKNLIKFIQEEIVKTLIEKSTEYNHLYGLGSEKYRKSLTPKIILWPYQHPKFFKPGGKQRWVKK